MRCIIYHVQVLTFPAFDLSFESFFFFFFLFFFSSIADQAAQAHSYDMIPTVPNLSYRAERAYLTHLVNCSVIDGCMGYSALL